MDDADYSKWLGPDWKPKWKDSGTIITNHINGLMDVLASIVLFYPGFVAVKDVKKMPCIGPIACSYDSIFLDRVTTKEERQKAVEVIEAR